MRREVAAMRPRIAVATAAVGRASPNVFAAVAICSARQRRPGSRRLTGATARSVGWMVRIASPAPSGDPSTRIVGKATVPGVGRVAGDPASDGPDVATGREAGTGPGAGADAGAPAGSGADGGPGPAAGGISDGGPVPRGIVTWVLVVWDWVESQHCARHPICTCQVLCCTTATVAGGRPVRRSSSLDHEDHGGGLLSLLYLLRIDAVEEAADLELPALLLGLFYDLRVGRGGRRRLEQCWRGGCGRWELHGGALCNAICVCAAAGPPSCNWQLN